MRTGWCGQPGSQPDQIWMFRALSDDDESLQPNQPIKNKTTVDESQTHKYFSAGDEKIEKRKSTVALYKAQTEVLQRYIVPAQDIVVYLKSPRRRR